eukprot:15062364-Ditylum_brightwellii.AAC.1
MACYGNTARLSAGGPRLVEKKIATQNRTKSSGPVLSTLQSGRVLNKGLEVKTSLPVLIVSPPNNTAT